MEKTDKQAAGEPAVRTGEDIDAREIAARIKRKVREKLAAGVYDENELDRVARLKLTMREESHNGHRETLARLKDAADATGPIDMNTHRSGPGALVARSVKKFYQKFVHRFVKFSLMRQNRFNDAAIELMSGLDSKTLFLSQRINFLGDKLTQIEGRLGKLAEIDDIRESLGKRVDILESSLREVDKQGIFLKRRMARLLEEMAKVESGADTANIAQAERAKLDSFDYRLFELAHRGSFADIKEKMRHYLDVFGGADGPVLDVGCGRGELLELFRENGVAASGVDMNEETCLECGQRGLDVTTADALSHMESLQNSSLGGVSAIQFVEHLPVDVMTRFFEIAYDKLKPGAMIAAETINPICLTTFCGPFYLDMSHTKPVHPMALQFMLERIGFDDVRIEYLNPYPDHMRLSRLPLDGRLDGALVEEFNANVDKLNGMLYSHTDYAVIARR